ncbi:phage tail protein [Photorhabdus temperata]|uniref:Microcystin-dependent protein n=1 Tax=Photorhabdus temperata subsp. temperata Meg1 TaxID=1393735 RepID=A0A081S1A9_PHOTE|nr:tail fiber protein [Photorhabdus temperata]KER04712.1 microcystin-dependent protein [Photorhabdus temperata subsp. temperata Meg1]MCT8345827.1 phage tail protein [Photorhabdus temperata]
MEKKHNISNSELSSENNNNNEDPSADDLKKRFKAGSIPLQTDYEHLINIADIGRKATGQAPKQNGPGVGLKLDDSGTLNLKIGTITNKDFSPLMLKEDILSVDLGSGLINKDNGICVGKGNGIVVNTDNVAVEAGNGINVGEKGVEVKAKNNGSISVDSEGIAVKCWKGGGIVVTDKTGLYLKLEGGDGSNAWSGVSGLSLSESGVKVKAGNGINVDKNGVSVKAGNGIKVDDKGVSIDPDKVLPRGMIVMFSGNSAPTGWAFCDGGTYNGVTVPDLRSRFVMCGETISETGKSSSKASGSGNGKNFSRNTTSTTVSVNVTVQNTTLTELQIPKHKHIESLPYFETLGFAYDNTNIGSTKYQINNTSSSSLWHPKASGNDHHPHTSEVGGGQGHDHKATASSPSHTHSVDVVPPYYILAFIMKL